MDFTKKYGGDSAAALDCLKLRLAAMMERVDLSSISSLSFRALCGIFRQTDTSGAADCRTTLLHAVDEAIFKTSLYLEMLTSRMDLEGDLNKVVRLEASARSDKYGLTVLREVVAQLDHIQSWVLLEYIEELSHCDVEQMKTKFFEVYRKIHHSKSNRTDCERVRVK